MVGGRLCDGAERDSYSFGTLWRATSARFDAALSTGDGDEVQERQGEESLRILGLSSHRSFESGFEEVVLKLRGEPCLK